MCGSFIRNLFGGSQPEPPPIMAAPTPPPPPTPIETAPADRPGTPTPGPTQEDESKRKAKMSSKSVDKKRRSAGTTQLQTPKPDQGGVQSGGTSQGVNTSGGSTKYQDPNRPKVRGPSIREVARTAASAPARDKSGRKYYKK